MSQNKGRDTCDISSNKVPVVAEDGLSINPDTCTSHSLEVEGQTQCREVSREEAGSDVNRNVEELLEPTSSGLSSRPSVPIERADNIIERANNIIASAETVVQNPTFNLTVNEIHQHHHHHSPGAAQQQLTYQDRRQYLTTIYNLPSQSYVASGDEGTKREFIKLQRATRKQYHPKYDVDLSNFGISPEGFPEIYPEMCGVDFYRGRFIPDDDKYRPDGHGIKLSTFDQAVTIDQLVSDIQKNSFVSVIGYPGSGKTTLLKRLARILAKSECVLVLRKLFMDMNDCNKQLTLKEFLLGDCNYNLNDEEKNSIFEWISANPENCFVILDGFDQASWNLQKSVKESNYNTPLHYWELLSHLCLGRFLQHCHLIFTSRPHAMVSIPKRCRPKRTYLIHDLTPDNMKTLFDALINDQQQSEVLSNNFKVKTPHLKSICYNPLMLQLYLRASLCSSQKIADISTMTRIFHTVLLNLKTSEHAISISNDIVIKLSKIAYEATNKGTVLITADDLLKENLCSQEVQDIVVTLLGANREYALLEGQQRLYFSHQTFQEYFSALYICREMSLPDFTSFVQNNLLKDHWSVVVQFTSGLLLDPFVNKGLSSSAIEQKLFLDGSQSTSLSSQITSTVSSSSASQQPSTESTVTQTPTSCQQTPSSQPLSNEKLQKKKMFISELYQKACKVAKIHNDGRSIVALSKILRESNDEEVITTTGRHFDGGRIRLKPSDTQNDIYAVTSFLKSMRARIGVLSLFNCEMTSQQFLPWIEAIKSMPGSIVEMDLHGNILSSVDDVIQVLGKVEEKMVMYGCRDAGDGGWRDPNMDERARMQEALDRLENKKLKIWIDVDDDRNYIYLTHKGRPH